MVYFISGHRDITKEEFEKYYVPKIDTTLENDNNATFVVGDYYGVDIMAQDYLVNKGVQDNVTVYHMFESPRNHNTMIKSLKGGFKNDEERDSAMTSVSDFDIAFVRNEKWKNSGTAINIRRRISFN